MAFARVQGKRELSRGNGKGVPGRGSSSCKQSAEGLEGALA